MNATNQDAGHLRLLSIFYYVWGGLSLCLSGLLGLVLVAGLFGMTRAMRQGGGPQPPAWLPVGIGLMFGAFVLFALVISALNLFTGKSLTDRRRYNLCLVVAALTCLSFPLGTALGVFTFVVLLRPAVRPLFA